MDRLSPKAADLTPDQAQTRATANHALHPTAVALTRLAFLKRLDEMKSLPKERQNVFVTNGGCGAGKGSLFGLASETLGGTKFGAVWDAAGEGDSSENTWILQAAQSRGLKVTYGFAQNDAESNYQGVLTRAEDTGRIVDPVTYQRSYVRGAEAMKAFLNSPEYKAAFDADPESVRAIGLDIPALRAEEKRHKKELETNPEAKKDSSIGKLGLNGRITGDDIKTGLDEVAVTQAAAEIFRKWAETKQLEIETDPTLTNEARRQKLQRLAWFIEGGATNTMKFEQKTTVATGDQTRAQEAAKKKRDDDGIKPFRG